MTNEKSKRTIMIVEDYDDTRLLLKQGLEGLGRTEGAALSSLGFVRRGIASPHIRRRSRSG
jgi:hypothetical protein